jgi:hypothetical protein
MNKLKLNLMQIFKDVLLRWSSKIKALSLVAVGNQMHSPAGKNHTDTPIKEFEGLDNSPIQFDSARTNDYYTSQGIMKKDTNPGSVCADGQTQMSMEELEALVFSQRNEIRKLTGLIQEEHNRSDLSITTEMA